MTQSTVYPPFKEIFVWALGYSQNLGKPVGFKGSWREVRENHKKDGRLIHTPVTWDTNPEHFAAFIAGISDKNTTINVAAYSWGGGWFFPRFAAALKKLGRSIRWAVLVDPVYRSKLLPTWLTLNIISMTRLFRIKMPDNVMNVSLFRQKQNRPAGRDIKGIPHTRIHFDEWLDLDHDQMDDAPEVKDEIIKRFTGQTTQG
jgi:pimeloyl-ACP methyl ester carboxylesterase